MFRVLVLVLTLACPLLQAVQSDTGSSSAGSSSDGIIQCEPIQVDLCSEVDYESTRMPNFYSDVNQIQASKRSSSLKELVKSKCSPHVLTYVCELLTPVCLKEGRDAMKRFDIFPCRSLCRRVYLDCIRQISKMTNALHYDPHITETFDCERLPFESNGGNGTLHGPCHEIIESETTAQSSPSLQSYQAPTSSSNARDKQQVPYMPYDNGLDQTPPPLDMDTSRIDPSLIRPNIRKSRPNDGQQLGLMWTVLIILLSGVLIIMGIMVIGLNAKRFWRAITVKNSGDGYQQHLNRHLYNQSTSSATARSLMISTGPDGKQPPQHIIHKHANNQYAYPKEHQLHSNILLSSPARQVLLLDDNNRVPDKHQAHYQAPTNVIRHQHQQLVGNGTTVSPYSTTTLSPYSVTQGNQTVYLDNDSYSSLYCNQLSMQRRSSKNNGSRHAPALGMLTRQQQKASPFVGSSLSPCSTSTSSGISPPSLSSLAAPRQLKQQQQHL